MSNKLNASITPYCYADNSIDANYFGSTMIGFFIGKNNIFTRYYGFCPVRLDIFTNLHGISTNKVSCYDLNLLECTKDLSDKFAKLWNLEIDTSDYKEIIRFRKLSYTYKSV